MKTLIPAHVQAYLIIEQIELGKWYDGGGIKKQLVGFDFSAYWGWQLVFSDKVTVRISMSFPWVEVEPELTNAQLTPLNPSPKKKPDNAYWEAKNRHETLCQSKLELNRTGRNKSMRNAYINQELESLRFILFQYANEPDMASPG